MAKVYELLDRLADAYGGQEIAPPDGEEAAICSSIPVMVSDVSDRGARLSGTNLPKQETEIFLRTDRFVLKARVAWSVGTACGIEFRDPLSAHHATHCERGGMEGHILLL